MPDIPLERAMVCWNSVFASTIQVPGRAAPGTVKVVVWPDRIDAAGPYQSSYGACNIEWRDAEKRLCRLFHLFNTMTVRDNIDPNVLHEALLVIPEYRQEITTDTPGATYIDEDGAERRYSNR